MRYLGLDAGKRYVQACLLNEDGSIIRERRYRYDEDGLENISLLLDEDDMAVLESTGNLWVRIYDLLRDRGVDVKLANPLKTRAIASAKIKSDKIDAKILAYLLKSDLIPESYVPDKYIMDIRRLIKHRISLVKSRTMAKNRIHSILDRYGYKHGFSDLFGKSGVEWLKSLDLRDIDKIILNDNLSLIEHMNKLIKDIDKKVCELAKFDDDIRLLLSLKGIDVYIALLIKSEIVDIKRFKTYKNLVSYAGLAPSLHQSGSVNYSGKITKQGRKMLRWALVEAAWSAVSHDDYLRSFYDRICRGNTHYKRFISIITKIIPYLLILYRSTAWNHDLSIAKTYSMSKTISP